eukprot:s63_g18.t1
MFFLIQQSLVLLPCQGFTPGAIGLDGVISTFHYQAIVLQAAESGSLAYCADPADAEEETIEQLPAELKENDELLNAEVAKTIDGKMFKGVVEDIEVGQISRDRLYRVRYTDGDLEHMTENEVREVLVALGKKLENDEGQVMMKRPAARKQTLEVVAEEDVEMGAWKPRRVRSADQVTSTAMPGLWVFLQENPDFYKNFNLEKGHYLETTLYEANHAEQGKGLWRILKVDQKTRDGMWMEARLVAVSDEHLYWWITEGAGATKKRCFRLHLCVTAERECPRGARKREEEFHTDYFRSIEAGDITESRVPWFKAPPAKDDVATEVAKLSGTAPRGRPRPRGRRGDEREGDLTWDVSDSDPLEELEAADEEGVKGKLTLKRRMQRRRKKKELKKKKQARKRSSASVGGAAKDPLWFGRRKSRTPRRKGRDSSSSSSTSKDKKKGSRKRQSSTSSEERKSKKKKRKRSDHADRGPYGVGQKQRYDGQISLSDSSDEDDDHDSQVFRAGPSSTSKHLQLQEYSERKPGRLTARLLRKMQTILAREEGPMQHQAGQNLTPPTATSYYLTVLVPQYKDRLNVRTSRELRSIAKALDLLAVGKSAKAGDVLTQRYKALELYLADQTWSRAQFLELIPAEGASLVEKDEVLMASKEQTEGPGLAAAKNEPKRPRSPLVKRRRRAQPPEGEDKGTEGFDPQVPEVLSDVAEGCPVNLMKLDVRVADDLHDWASYVKDVFKLRSTFTDLGRHLLGLISSMPTPLGNFVRSFCLAAQPPTASGSSKEGGHGDLLPIPVWRITSHLDGVDDNNIDWVKVVICCINFHYCTGWAKPICVPIPDALSDLQKHAISKLASSVASNILTADQLLPFAECDNLLASKKYDYAGRPVEYMEDLECDKVVMAWPAPGKAAVQPLEAFLNAETIEAMSDPYKLLLPKEKMPHNALRSRVRASDTEWFRIVRAAWERGMMKAVDDGCVPWDRSGHLITNGAGAVFKEKIIDGRVVAAQRFISILCPINSVTMPIIGDQETLPYIGQLSGILLEEHESLYLESEDLQSAFNLFAVPDRWLGFFSYSKKVDGAALGLQSGVQVRPALSVVPMGWHSAVGLVQQAVRDLIFNKSQIPRALSAEKGRPLPPGKNFVVVYLDNYDEIEIIRTMDVDLSKQGVEMTDHHKKFVEACDAAGLPRNEGKQLIHAFAGAMQGGEFDGRRGILKLGPDKLRNYIQLSLALLARRSWGEFPLRHWTGKTAFLATFRRSLFSGLGCIFNLIEKARSGEVTPTMAAADEVMVLCCLSPMGQTNLRATLSGEISCTDASPSGGGSGSASKFVEEVPGVPEKLPASDLCGQCCQAIDASSFGGYECPNECGVVACCIDCIAAHRHSCIREMMGKPCFGERFSGPNCPLTKAVALAGIFVQPPLDRLRDGNWDFFSTAGRDCLEGFEDDGHLAASHWAPECKTFSAARGRPIWTSSGRYIPGPPALRSHDKPWGLNSLSKENQVKVRQGNAMGKRSLQGVKEAHQQDRFASLEHPWFSHLWYTPEALELCGIPGIFVTAYSACCFGGSRTKWTALVHNIPEVHRALHTPECPGHPNLLPYEVHDDHGVLTFDTAEEAEYPWQWCRAYAAALKAQLEQMRPSPPAGVLDEKSSIMAALRSSTRGFQNPQLAAQAADVVLEVMSSMSPGNEREHLKLLLRHVCLRGTDVKLMSAAENGSQSVMSPYPAFKWDWKVRLSFAWRQEQHINVLEISAFLVEFRRRTRQRQQLGSRYFNVTDSQAASPNQCPEPYGRCLAGPPVDYQQMEFRRRAKSAVSSFMTRAKHLKTAGISKRTLGIYKREVSLFFKFLDQMNLRLPRSYARLDQLLADYINHLYQDDETLTKAGWVLSAMKRLYPRVRRELPIAQQWYNNWCREHTPRRATPITWEIIQGFVGVCIRLRWYRLAIVLLVGFVFFLRTAEVLALDVSDILCSEVDGSVVIRIGTSKTSPGAQQSLAHFDLQLVSLLRMLLQRCSRSQELWPYSSSHFRNSFLALVTFFELQSLQLAPYSLRRGGATFFYTKTNCLDPVMIRGRWKDAATARIYLDDARATLVRMALSPSSRALLRQFRRHLVTFMSRFASRAKGKAKAKAKAADPVVQEEEEAQDMETTEAPEEEPAEADEAGRDICLPETDACCGARVFDAMGSDEENPSVQHTFTDGSETSDGSDESVYPPSSDDLEGVLVAFCAMEYRRLRRIRNGRIVKDGLGRHLNSAMKGIIVVLLLAEVFDITTQRFGIQQVWIIPAGLTLALVIPAAVQTLYYPEHTFTLWVSTELYAFCLWFAWWFDARDESNKDTLHCWRLPQSNWFAAEQICVDVNQIMAFYVFVAILLATIVLFLPHRVIMPCAIYFNFLQGRWLVNWRAVRRLPKLPGDRDDSWHYTYKPSGLFGWNREEFMYIGEVDSDGRPHGGGFWYDSSFHGECLRGEWVHGAPAGMWFSREYGTGAHFLQCAVGYATARSDCKKDTLHKSALFPHKDQELRFGLGQVEASFAGGFFPFLPAVNYHFQMKSGEDLVEQLLHVYQKRQAHEEPSNLRLEVLPEATFQDMYVGEWSQVPIHFCEGENLGYVPEQTISRVRSSRPSAEALVFIHGFNCDLATALGRVAQTFSLGNMPPHIVPFVFSYAGGLSKRAQRLIGMGQNSKPMKLPYD